MTTRKPWLSECRPHTAAEMAAVGRIVAACGLPHALRVLACHAACPTQRREMAEMADGFEERDRAEERIIWGEREDRP